MDREKVIKSLELCVQGSKGCLKDCPYTDKGCRVQLEKDALELLKEQEARVMTLDEALGSDDPVYFESKGRMECWVDAYISDDLQCAVFYRFRSTEFMLPLSRYKKDWRCWSAPPSYEQSKAVKWE